jgi:hypothetical protein
MSSIDRRLERLRGQQAKEAKLPPLPERARAQEPMTPSSTSIGYVYFIEAVGAGRIKIGFTSDPLRRFSELVTGSPFPLERIKVIYGDRSTETWWHQKFEDARVHNEWFRATPHLRKAIANTAPASVNDGDGRVAYEHARECFVGLRA